MARLGLFGLLLLAAVPAAAHPAYVPIDPPTALVQSDPGRTTFVLACDASGWSISVARSLTAACDVVAVMASSSLFDLRVRIGLFPALFPLRTAFEWGWSGFEVLGALHLGPVQVVGDRRWGGDAQTRIALTGASSELVASAGAILRGTLEPFVAVTWLPEATPLRSLTLRFSSRGVRVTIGGTW